MIISYYIGILQVTPTYQPTYVDVHVYAYPYLPSRSLLVHFGPGRHSIHCDIQQLLRLDDLGDDTVHVVHDVLNDLFLRKALGYILKPWKHKHAILKTIGKTHENLAKRISMYMCIEDIAP